jgi:hypothetical protein
MNNRESQAIFESYRQGKVIKLYLTEQEQQQTEVKQQLQQELSKPETQQAVVKTAEELFQKYKQQIDAAKQQGDQAVEKLLQQIQNELTQQVGKEVQKESLELQEGWLDRLRSRGAGALRQGKELMRGGQQPTKGFDTHAVTKRFEILQNSIGKDLRELERDLSTASDTDKTVKDQVSQMIQTLGSQHSIAPVQSKLGDVRHAIGRGVQNVGIGALLGAGLAAAAAPVVAAIGLTGPAAAAVGAGFSGATTSALKDLIYGQKPDAKRAAIMGVGAAVAAGLLSAATQSGQGGGTQPEPAPSPTPTPVPSPTPSSTDLNQLFKVATTTDFNPASKLDSARMGVLKMLDQLNTEKGLGLSTTQLAKVFGDWSSMADAGKNASYEMVKKAVQDPQSAQQITKLLAKAGNLVQK